MCDRHVVIIRVSGPLSSLAFVSCVNVWSAGFVVHPGPYANSSYRFVGAFLGGSSSPVAAIFSRGEVGSGDTRIGISSYIFYDGSRARQLPAERPGVRVEWYG